MQSYTPQRSLYYLGELWATPSGAQGLLQALCTGITPDRKQDQNQRSCHSGIPSSFRSYTPLSAWNSSTTKIKLKTKTLMASPIHELPRQDLWRTDPLAQHQAESDLKSRSNCWSCVRPVVPEVVGMLHTMGRWGEPLSKLTAESAQNLSDSAESRKSSNSISKRTVLFGGISGGQPMVP